MVRLIQNQKGLIKCWTTVCKNCSSDITFQRLSPIYCSKCRELVIDFSGLIENIENRKGYYKKGDKYDPYFDV